MYVKGTSMNRNSPIVWCPILGSRGLLAGIELDEGFAEACALVPYSTDLHERCLGYVWRLTKPNHVEQQVPPSNLFTFVPGGLLVSMVQHYSDHGKWLDCSMADQLFWRDGVRRYSFHHVGHPQDDYANRWVQFAFSYWIKFMLSILKMSN